MKYDKLIKDLRICSSTISELCETCSHNESGDCYNKLKRDASNAIEGLLSVIQRQKEMINATAYLPLYQKPMKWISVTERLPSACTYVLISYQTVFGPFCDVTYIDNRGKWKGFQKGRVTHWMPLPSTEGLYET